MIKWAARTISSAMPSSDQSLGWEINVSQSFLGKVEMIQVRIATRIASLAMVTSLFDFWPGAFMSPFYGKTSAAVATEVSGSVGAKGL